MLVKDKLYIITGASSGLGKETCRFLDSLGARVVGIARREERLKELQGECKNFAYKVFDFSKQEGIKELIESIVKEYGKVNGMAYFAGIGRINPLRSENMIELKRLFEVHFFSAFECIKVLCDKRKSSNLSVVLVSSISSKMSFEGLSAYGSAKGAINALSVISKDELLGLGCRVNAILPGDIDTEMTAHAREFQAESYQNEAESYPLGKGNARDIANLVAFLLSDISSGIRGQNIAIDGGRSSVGNLE